MNRDLLDRHFSTLLARIDDLLTENNVERIDILKKDLELLYTRLVSVIEKEDKDETIY